jgi:excisionase family DNA binding protein
MSSPVILPVLLTKQFYKLDEVAVLLSVARCTVRRWCDEGSLQSIRTPGNHRRIARSAIEAYMSQRWD